ncbi:MAG TPA: HPr family phosphocarrier protein [Gemmatales bacterium]|nr:HPr family phosphocarrier protein [Gemmatales bacterium]HMP59794.1 HPr family phosphocarrier protein [Gemmatales bacterium]
MGSKANGDSLAPSWDGEPGRPVLRSGPEASVLHQRVVIQHPDGLHLRPAVAVAQAAHRFDAEAVLIRGDVRANARSVMDMFLLLAERGTEIELEVRGPEANGALAALVDILTAPTLPEADEDRTLPPKG